MLQEPFIEVDHAEARPTHARETFIEEAGEIRPMVESHILLNLDNYRIRRVALISFAPSRYHWTVCLFAFLNVVGLLHFFGIAHLMKLVKSAYFLYFTEQIIGQMALLLNEIMQLLNGKLECTFPFTSHI